MNDTSKRECSPFCIAAPLIGQSFDVASVKPAAPDAVMAITQTAGGRSVHNQTRLRGYFDFTIFTAVREQLGLRLESGKGPVEVIVIDHRPQRN